VVVKTRRIAIAASSLFGLVLLGTTLHAPAAGVPASLTLDGAAIAGAPVSFSGHGSPSSSARIVVVPAVFNTVGAIPSAQFPVQCYLGTPTALGTADVTTDSSGNIGPTLTWGSAVPGSYRGLLLQRSCSRRGGRNTEAASDQVIVAEQDFTVADSVPALSAWGFAALGLALSVAGCVFLSRTRA
jgi:hypothetical protein